MSFLPLPLENILADMWRAFSAQLYYPALLVALTLPEVCAALRLDKSEFVKKKHYIDFIDNYAPHDDLRVTGLDCYQLRGGLVHRANAAGHAFYEGTHVIFTVPETGNVLHAFTLEVVNPTTGAKKSAMMLDLRTFCSGIDTAVRAWHKAHGAEPKVIESIKGLISWRPNGLPPFLDGAPVVGSGSY